MSVGADWMRLFKQFFFFWYYYNCGFERTMWIHQNMSQLNYALSGAAEVITFDRLNNRKSR